MAGRASSGAAPDSVAKLRLVLALCEELGVIVRPTRVGRLWLVPVLSWHHKDWDSEPDIPGVPRASPMTISVSAADLQEGCGAV